MFSTAADMAPIVRARTRSAAPGTPAAARSAQKSAISAAAPSSTVDSCHSGAEPPESASMPWVVQPHGPDQIVASATAAGSRPSAAHAARPASTATRAAAAGVARRSQRQLAG